MMQPPRWDDPIGSACREAERSILRGLPVRPTLYGFVDEEPVLRVQPGVSDVAEGDSRRVAKDLSVVSAMFGIEQAVLFSRARTTDETVDDEHLCAALATYGITVEVAQRDADEVVTDAYLVGREVVDGEVRWQAPERLDGGLWSGVLEHAVAPPPAVAEAGIDPATIAYVMSRAGNVVEVAPGWRERFATDRLERREVRRVDRRRARELTRAGAPRRRGGQEVRA